MNRDIDKIIKTNFQKDDYIPNSTKDKIDNILKQKRNIVIKVKNTKTNIMKKLVTIVASTIVVFIGSISAYAAFGGTISGKPIFKWFGIKFSNEYDNYKVTIEGQEIAHNETKIDLVSTVCDDGFTILEFDVKLSKEDKEYLRLGEHTVTEKDLEDAKVEDEKYKTDDGIVYGNNYNGLLEYKDMINTVKIGFNADSFEAGVKCNNIIIDNEEYWAIQHQTASKISDYEYKVYQLYFLTDKELNGKTDFTLTLKVDSLGNTADLNSYTGNRGVILGNTGNNSRKIELNGEFNINVSKNKALENTTIITPECEDAKYKNMTKKVEQIKVTPLQIIVKVSTKIDNVSLQSLSYTRGKDYIGIVDFKAYDSNGNKLKLINYETKRTINYANGKTEEWSPGDIGTYKDFYNATMELEEYIIIEKGEDINSISIIPSVREPDFSQDLYKENDVNLQAFEINLK